MSDEAQVEMTLDEIDIVVEALMNLATCYDGVDAEYTGKIVTLHNRLAMLVSVSPNELN